MIGGKKMKKKTMIFFVALLVMGAVVTSVLAYPFNGKGQTNMPRNNNQALMDAITAGDYNAYITAFDANDQPFMMQKLTEAQFNERVTQYKELQADKTNIQTAVASGDYNAWYNAETDLEKTQSLTNIITKDNFGNYTAMYNAERTGDWQTASTIAQELGIRGRMNRGMGNIGMHGAGFRGKGIGRGRNMNVTNSIPVN